MTKYPYIIHNGSDWAFAWFAETTRRVMGWNTTEKVFENGYPYYIFRVQACIK